MRVPSTIGRSDIGINLTPMIDVVFQLIIFFLVSSHLVKQEAQMALPLPVADSGQEPADEAGKRLTLNVLSDGSLLLAGRRVRTEELPSRLSEVAAQQPGPLEIRIRADRTVPYRFVDPVLTACARAGLWDVKFSVYRSEDVR
jgi:biopolymer transport protein ExbD